MDTEYLLQFEEGKRIERILSSSGRILADLGLTLDDVLQRKKVLDLGAEDAIVENAAKIRGHGNTVVSLSLGIPEKVRGAGLSYIKAQAKQVPFRKETFDLVISRNGPLYYLNTETDTDTAIMEILRILTENGECRVSPIRFGFIKQQLFSANPEYSSIHSKSPTRRSSRDLERLRYYTDLADEATIKYLQKHTINFSVEESKVNKNNYIKIQH